MLNVLHALLLCSIAHKRNECRENASGCALYQQVLPDVLLKRYSLNTRRRQHCRFTEIQAIQPACLMEKAVRRNKEERRT